MLAPRPIRSALVIAPHADDEAIGAGGLIARLTAAGVPVTVLFAVVDGFHHHGLEQPSTLEQRQQEIAAAAAILSFEYEVAYLGRDLIEKLDTVPQRELVDLFEAKLDQVRPDLLLLPHGVDYDQDHRACFQAAFAAARPIPETLGKFFPRRVLTYESPKLGWSEQPFQPSMYWEISDQLETKCRAIAAYQTQLRSAPHIRSLDSIRDLARMRGREAGVVSAEAFSLLRWVD
ncbi:MAG: PIG-L family deacetylase [Pseudomonadota bacterium]